MDESVVCTLNIVYCSLHVLVVANNYKITTKNTKHHTLVLCIYSYRITSQTTLDYLIPWTTWYNTPQYELTVFNLYQHSILMGPQPQKEFLTTQ